MTKLKDVCEKASSNVKQSDLQNNNGAYPIFGASGFIKNVDFYQQDKPYVAVVKDGAIGKVMYLPAFSSVTSTVQYIIPNPNVNGRYLPYALEHMGLEKYRRGAVIPHIYFKDYCMEELPAHSEQEQNHIASVLEKNDSLILLRKRQLAKLDELVKARFVEMFGDPVNNSKNFPVHQFADYIRFLTSGSRGWAQYYSNSGEWFITITNVKNCKITTENIQHITPPHNAEAKRTRVQEGDLLISITADLGRTGIVTKQIAEHGAYINQHLTLIRLNKNVLDPCYVAFFMESEAGKRQFYAKNLNSVKAGLNFDSIRSLQLMTPPLELQERFAAFVEQTEKSKLAIRKGLNRLETLKAALTRQYFNPCG